MTEETESGYHPKVKAVNSDRCGRIYCFIVVHITVAAIPVSFSRAGQTFSKSSTSRQFCTYNAAQFFVCNQQHLLDIARTKFVFLICEMVMKCKSEGVKEERSQGAANRQKVVSV